jgi:hypothetical protein
MSPLADLVAKANELTEDVLRRTGAGDTHRAHVFAAMAELLDLGLAFDYPTGGNGDARRARISGPVAGKTAVVGRDYFRDGEARGFAYHKIVSPQLCEPDRY